ncbi:MAG: phosphatase PAP2 family protein [Anaeromyxobacteraceae bacterium]
MPLAPSALALLLVAGSPTPAVEPPRDVYRLHPALDAAVLAVASTAALLPYLLQDRIVHPRCPCDRAEIPGFERWVVGHRSAAADHASDALAVVSIAGPAAAEAWLVGLRSPLGTDLVVFAETVLVNGALVTTVKDLVQRPTPRAYAGDPGITDRPIGYRAFHSGHTSNTVAALTAAAWTARWRYGAGGWPWVAVGVVGAGVGALRIAGGNHFPSDVLVGAAAGFGVGTLVPWLHRRHAPDLALVPVRGGLALAGRL